MRPTVPPIDQDAPVTPAEAAKVLEHFRHIIGECEAGFRRPPQTDEERRDVWQRLRLAESCQRQGKVLDWIKAQLAGREGQEKAGAP